MNMQPQDDGCIISFFVMLIRWMVREGPVIVTSEQRPLSALSHVMEMSLIMCQVSESRLTSLARQKRRTTPALAARHIEMATKDTPWSSMGGRRQNTAIGCK